MDSYSLKHPVKFNGNQVDRVTIRGVELKDLKESENFEGNSFKGARWIVKHICELPEDIVDNMNMIDFNEISKLILEKSDILKEYSK